ncbi:hypothetical protein [Bdellovibrio sp. HCB274]|uniref:hypothetical protein n=1 Tax=Bdellovibrio sp. HCB274 TaxID=3394361 RepID=UPI0039B592F2
MTADYFIDNSALNKILRNQDLSEQTVAGLTQSQHRLFVSFDTFLENTAGDSTDSIFKRMNKLHEIYNRSTPGQFYFAKAISKWLHIEIRNNGRMRHYPTIHTEDRWELFLEYLSDRKTFDHIYHRTGTTRNFIKDSKTGLKKSDNLFRMLSVFSQSEIRYEIENINFYVPAYKMNIFKKVFGLSNRQIKKVIYTPRRSDYNLHRTHFMLGYLRMLGNAYTEYKDNDELSFLNRIAAGNWYDLSLLVQACRAHYVITEDADQLAMSNFLHKRGLIKAQGISLEDFISKIEPK